MATQKKLKDDGSIGKRQDKAIRDKKKNLYSYKIQNKRPSL